MKNLILIKEQFALLQDVANQEIVGVTETGASGSYFLITKNGIILGVNTNTGEVFAKVNLKEEISEEEEAPLIIPQSEIIGFQYVAELEAICIATNVGDILAYEVQTRKTKSVGAVEEGINAMAWSPDQEVVVFATGNNTLLTMTKDWEILVENPIDVNPIGKPQPATTSSAAATEQGPVTPTIVWRADGKLYAVTSQDEDKKTYVRVWDRSGSLFAKSEVINGLGSKLSWRPDNSIIAGHQYLSNKDETNIVFIEKNGLQHYEFLLEKGRSAIKQVQWNIDSDLLAVYFVPHGQTTPSMQLWYRSNYHWYLKQEFKFAAEKAPSYISWDAALPLRLHAVNVDGTYTVYDFCWDHNISQGDTKENSVLAVVVDGKKLNFTPMRYAVVPPPMSSASMSLNGTVRSVTFLGYKLLAVQLVDGSISVYGVQITLKPPAFGLPPKLLYTVDTGSLNVNALRLLTMINESTFYAVESSKMGQGDNLVTIKLSPAENGVAKVESVQRVQYNEKIIRIATHDFSGSTFVQTASGTLFIHNVDKEATEYPEAFGQACPQFSICLFDGEETPVGLTARGVLYIQSNVASSTCSSYCMHDQFLLFTTYAHKLRIIPLSISVSDALDLTTAAPSSKYDESFREIERGAKVVCAIPADIKVVQQMPRGNLEGIYPHSIILAHVKNLLNQFHYKEAVSIARKYKVDMNLIYDHSPQALLDHAEEFVQKVVDPDYINLFISGLNPQDSTVVRYPGYFTTADQHNDATRKTMIENKINLVCKTFRAALQKNEKKYISSILTTYAKHSPPELEEALTIIRQLRAEEAKGEASDRASSEEALTYLIFLADVNKLYDVALGMYDFELVLTIAQKSQKDPKEYLPFLATLQKMETFYQRYSIDSYLNKFESALKNLSQAGPQYFDECLKLIKQKNLYKLGAEIFESDAEKKHSVYDAFGDYLMSKREYKEAGYAFLQSEKLEKAQEAFKKSGDYKYAFALARQLKQTKEQQKALARQIADVLQLNGNLKEVAVVYREYLGDNEEAVISLIKGQYWEDALRIATIAERNDLIETHIKPGVVDAASEKLTELDENKTKLEKYVKRLKEVREEKAKHQIESGFGEDEPGLRDIDAFSEASSVQSGTSSYSGVSVLSKSSRASTKTGLSRASMKKREKTNEKRKHKLKKGSPFEEENLVTRLGQLVPSKAYQEEMGRLLEALMFFGHMKQAKALQIKLKELIAVALQHAETIEAPYIPSNHTAGAPPKQPQRVVETVGTVSWSLSLLEDK